MQTFRLIPTLGLKTNVPQNSPTLLQPVAEGVVLAHCCNGSLNIDYNRIRDACNKAFGRFEWSASANGTATLCLGLFHHYDASNDNWTYWMFDSGEVYRFDATLTPQNVNASPDVGFATDSYDLYSIIQFGDYMVFSDRGENTPYKCDSNDANLTKLIQSGTEYKFRYLESFRSRIFGVYSDQTNGDLDIRWTDSLISADPWSALSFPAGNQLYKPDDDPIVGIKRLGHNACYLYGENTIDRIEYYASYTTPFSIVNLIGSEGAANHQSIVSTGSMHFLFNKNLGFCAYDGTTRFPSGGKPISEAIEDRVAAISPAYYNKIIGTHIRLTTEIVWTVPAGGSATHTQLWFYNYLTGQWRFEDKIARWVDNWEIESAYTWSDLATALGGASAVWSDVAAGAVWTDYTGARTNRLILADTDGKLYYYGSDDDAGSAYTATRIEPMLDFGRPEERDLLLEIWMGIGYRGAYNIDVYHRGGDTEAEVGVTSWTSKGTISCNDPANAVLYLSESARLHQIKWETNAADERFAVNNIEFRYQPQSRY